VAQSTVRLIVDASNAINPLKRVNEQTKQLSKNTNKLKNNLNGSNRALSATGPAAARSAGGVRTLTSALGPLLKALALISAAKFIFVQSGELETQTKSLEVLTGSLKQTKQIIEELQAFGSVTPFTSSELIEQTKRLKAFGFETEKLVDTTKRIADIAGATGADLAGIATAFGQIQAKGKLQQEENLQLLERGVNITDELQKITGKFGDEFADAMRRGEIGADLVNQAMINLTNEGGAFFGGATEQATTLNGKLSTLVDTVQSLARTIGKILGPTIKFVLDQTTRAVKAIDNLLKRFQNIGKIGFGKVLGAENKAQKDAAKLTTTKFGLKIKKQVSFLKSKKKL
jgi:tape measure domain-containing protein